MDSLPLLGGVQRVLWRRRCECKGRDEFEAQVPEAGSKKASRGVVEDQCCPLGKPGLSFDDDERSDLEHI